MLAMLYMYTYMYRLDASDQLGRCLTNTSKLTIIIAGLSNDSLIHYRT